jgi:hypothetical protein
MKREQIIQGYELITISPDEEYIRLFEEYRDAILTKNDPSDQKMIRNYEPDRLKVEDQLCVSLLVEDYSVVAFSTLLHRDCYGQAARCLNRLYFDPSIRTWNRVAGNQPSLNPRVNVIGPAMVMQQQAFMPDNSNVMFISKEPFKTRWAKKTAANYNNSTPLEWTNHEMLYPVCDQDQASCWQHLIYTTTEDTLNTLLDKGISFDEYRSKFNANT